MGQGSVRFRLLVASVSAAAVLLALPALAAATTVVNGNFETGSLAGWSQVSDTEISEDGAWFAYSGTANPFEVGESPPVPAPPQGSFAAITAQGGPGARFLYQDVALEPGYSHVLTLIAYYQSIAALVTPEPNVLSAAGEPNQQYRIDVIKPTAPIDTLEPADILATVLQTETGDPETMAAKTMTADLTAFGGQTVRLRFSEVDNKGFFNAGVDAVSISGPPPPPPAAPAPPSNAFTFGKLTLNKKKGTAKLKVTVPGAGQLVAVDAKKKGPKRIQRTSFTATAGGIAALPLKATKAGKKTLEAKGKLKFKLRVTFTPTGGSAATQAFSGKLKLNLPPPR